MKESLDDRFSSGDFVASGVVHLQDKVAVIGVHLAGVEGCATASEGPIVGFQPATSIERVEVIFPVEVEATSLSVVRLNLDVVVVGVPRHASVAEVVAPACERGCPEIHHQDLWLVKEENVGCVLNVSHNISIETPRDVGGCPLDHVLVHVGMWLEGVGVLLVLLLPLPDNVRAERVISDRRDKLHVDFIPSLLGPVRASPVGKEGGDGAVLVSSLHTRGETTVSEGLVRLDLSTDIVGTRQAGGTQDNSKAAHSSICCLYSFKTYKHLQGYLSLTRHTHGVLGFWGFGVLAIFKILAIFELPSG